MKFLGLPVPFTKSWMTAEQKALSMVPAGRGGWTPVVMEANTGNWQRNIVVNRTTVLLSPTVYTCISLIAGDISKLRVELERRDSNDIWTETTDPKYSKVLAKPNDYQNRIQFWESWIISKLSRGNTYVLKQRNAAGLVEKLYVLDPDRVWPLVGDDGSVFYRLSADNLSGIDGDVIVPAREMIHDRMNTLFHPLVGTSPIIANGLAATQGINIQNQSARFFGNNANPGGILTAPGRISQEQVDRLTEDWALKYSGDNAGKVVVLGDGLAYTRLAMTAEEGQMIEQLRWTAEIICSTFHVPGYKVGIGQMPTNNNVQALNLEYYQQALQKLIEDAEICLDEGLELGPNLTVCFDLEGLLRMDSTSLINVLKLAVGAGIMSPNEARAKMDLKPVTGGESPMIQEQNYSLGALAKRDAKDDPFAKGTTAAAPPAAPPANDTGDAPADDAAPEDQAAALGVAAMLLRATLLSNRSAN